MLKRRSFLASILAAGVAPAFVKAGVLIPVKEIWVPPVEAIVLTSAGLEKKLCPMEIGQIETFRFIESPNDTLGQYGFINAKIKTKSVNLHSDWMNALMERHA